MVVVMVVSQEMALAPVDEETEEAKYHHEKEGGSKQELRPLIPSFPSLRFRLHRKHVGIFIIGVCNGWWLLALTRGSQDGDTPEDSLGSSVTRALNARTIRETETGHHFRFYFACLSVSLYFACFHF